MAPAARIPHRLGRSRATVDRVFLRCGTARIIFAELVVLAISTGLLLGLTLLGVSLPVDQAGRAVPLWLDTIAAGMAVAGSTTMSSTVVCRRFWRTTGGKTWAYFFATRRKRWSSFRFASSSLPFVTASSIWAETIALRNALHCSKRMSGSEFDSTNSS
jgi:hypothetical protein